jgi:prophage maintenance system killer protein
MKTAQAQNIFHGNVMPDKYAKTRVPITSDQPVTRSTSPAYAPQNTQSHRTKKRSTRRRLSQLATWVEDPIVFKIQQHARKKNLSQSATIRRLLIKVLADEEGVNEALDTEALREALARDNRRMAKRLVRLLAWLLYDVGQVKALANNTLGMQKGMTEQMHKDILTDANRQTKARFSRQNPDLAEFMDAIEKWLVAGEEAGRGESRA